jgi:RNA polymerase sigma-70 factor (ECF subfamily)
MDQALDFASIIPTITRYARGLTRSNADADDLVQMTCEHALTQAEQWEPGTRLDGWACQIMHAMWLSEVRARNTRVRHLSAYGADRQDLQHDGERDAQATLDLHSIARGLSHLSDGDQQLMTLVCLEGRTYREAAAEMNIPIGTVMSRLSRLRDRLTSTLATSKRVLPPMSRASGRRAAR